MTLPGLVRSKNLSDVEDRERAWDNLGSNINAVIQATNSIRNNTMVGAVAGTPGTLPTNWSLFDSNGLSRSIVGTGIEDEIFYIDIRFFGSLAAGGGVRRLYFYWDSFTAISVAQRQIWTHSCYAKIVAGSLTGIVDGQLYLVINNGTTIIEAPTQSFNYSSLTGPLSECRVFQTDTFINAASAYVQPRIDVNFSNDANDIDFTLRIGMPQLERGPFLTPPIATSNAPASALATVSITIKGKDVLALSDVSGTSTSDFIYIKDLTNNAQQRITSASQATTSGVTRQAFAMPKNTPTTSGAYFFPSGTTLSGSSLQINGTNALSIATSPFSGDTATTSISIDQLRPQANWRISEPMASGLLSNAELAIPFETSDFVLFMKAGQS